ncbi:hypothetical protein RSAG8_05969, partial [Rhizoctonia solani AG-8 WAC10335]
MCSIKSEACEAEAAIGHVKLECGGIDIVLPGANTEREGSEPPTPKESTQALPELIKKEEEEEDDPLSYLVNLFYLTTLDDPDDSDGSEPDSETPLSPRPKGFNQYCFYASDGRLYYFDVYRNVYSQDGTVISYGSSNYQADDLLTPSFYIDGVPYWFDTNSGLVYQGADGTVDRVHICQSDPEPLDLGQVFEPTLFQFDPATLQPEPIPEPYYNPSPPPVTTLVSNGDYSTPKAKSEVLSPPNTQPLQRTLQGSKDLPWSPGSSAMSPIVTSRDPSEDPPLFADSQSGLLLGTQIVGKWQQDTAQAQQDAAKARPVRKPSKDERRRCPVCGKMFRRPSSLEDHRNVHSGDKPHTCPFKGCNAGFATGPNMRRHFLTHRVGTLERYRPGLTPSEAHQPGTARSGKPPRAPTSTYNSKEPHTLQFGVAA